MSHGCQSRVYRNLLGGLVIWLVVGWCGHAAWPATLAKSVPGDIRLFLEVNDAGGLLKMPAGSVLADALAGMVTTVRGPAASQPATSQPATSQAAPAAPGWRKHFAEAIGLPSSAVSYTHLRAHET